MTLIMLFALAMTGGILLQKSYSLVQINALKEQLKVHSYNLLAQIEYQDNQLLVPRLLPDQHFNDKDSGLYSIILDSQHQRIWSSISAIDLPNFTPNEITVGNWQYSLANNGEEELFIARYGVSWGESRHSQFNLLLMADMKTINEDLNNYKKTLLISLGSAASFLLIMQLIILRWGLNPLNRVINDLKKIQGGENTQLSGSYPKELRPLTKNLNHLLEVEQSQRERYRNSLADLSHSLKTPISIMTGIVHQDKIGLTEKNELESQLDKMTNTIRYQLQRAVNGFQGLYINRIPIKPMVKSITDAMQKVYSEKALTIKLDIPIECHFHGDENDLFEVLANLIDNACKYGKKSISIAINSTNNILIIEVHDDGSGIPKDQRESILTRGVRLDSMEVGQGMGLALVKEILQAYQAHLHIADSSLGGTCFTIQFNTQFTNNN